MASDVIAKHQDDYPKIIEMLQNKDFQAFEDYIASRKCEEIENEIQRYKAANWRRDIDSINKRIVESNTDNLENQYLCYATPRPELKLKETNKDFISDENSPGTVAPSPQKTLNELYMFNDWECDDGVIRYAIIYGDIAHFSSSFAYSDFRITYELSKQYPAFIVSENPLEAILNMVVWVLDNCVNDYNYQTWFRGWDGVNHLFTDNGIKISKPKPNA